MRLVNAQALVLGVRELGERDRVVVLLTAEHGRKDGVASGARTKYSRFAGQLQPLAKVAVTWFEKEARPLVRIRDVALVRPAAALQEDLEGILLGSYLAEHMMVFAQDNEPAPKLFRLLDTTVEAMLAGCDRRLAARYLEIWTLRLAGVFPPPRACPYCDVALAEKAVVTRDGALVCASCHAEHEQESDDDDGQRGIAAGFVVGRGVLELLRRSAGENLEALSGRPPSAKILARTEQLCARVRRAFLQDELKSYRVMRQTLGVLGSG